jgi:hypothetical protein
MINVGLLTTWDERCGIAEYGKNLAKHMPDTDVQFHILQRPQWNVDYLLSAAAHVDLFHLNYEPGLFTWLNATTIQQMKAAGKSKPFILTLHTSHAGDNRGPFTDLFDKVIVHEKTLDGFDFIPQGVPTVTTSRNDPYNPFIVGTVGFPFPWKGFDIVAQATAKLGLACRVIAPKSHHWDAEGVARYLYTLNPELQVITDWLEQDQVIHKLRECSVNVFAYQGHPAGISGAVKLGVAAQRPLVVTMCRQFRDMYETHPEELYIADPVNVDTVAEAIDLAIKERKFPNALYEENKWSVVVALYKQVYLDALNLR